MTSKTRHACLSGLLAVYQGPMGIISTVASLLSLFFPSKQSNAHSFYYTYIPQPNDNPNKSALVFFKYSSYLRGTDKTNAAPFYLSRNHKFINVDFYSSTSHKGISLYFSLIRSGDTFLPQTLKIIIKKSYLYSIKIPEAFLACVCFRSLFKNDILSVNKRERRET